MLNFGCRRWLVAMLSHAAKYSPYYRDQDWAVRLCSGENVDFKNIPVTPKKVLREQTSMFFSSFIPPGEGNVTIKHTSGSTGKPMEVRKTARHFRCNLAENMRLRQGWGFENHQKMAQILFPDESHPIGWREQRKLDGGLEWDLSTLDADEALGLFRESNASLVYAFPSIMLGVLQRSEELFLPLQLQLIVTISEVVPDELRELIHNISGCRLMDRYGNVEAGLIAVQCPQCNSYHPADRHLLLEIITDNGLPAKIGEMGRIIVTPFFNAAMPLVRYETGDYAVLGESGNCTRSHLAISRIVGRESDLFKLPGGGKVAAMLPSDVVHGLGLRQFKLFQTSLTDIELHYIPCSGGMIIDDAQAQMIVNRHISTRFKVHCRQVAEIPRAPSGKYIMYESLI